MCNGDHHVLLLFNHIKTHCFYIISRLCIFSCFPSATLFHQKLLGSPASPAQAAQPAKPAQPVSQPSQLRQPNQPSQPKPASFKFWIFPDSKIVPGHLLVGEERASQAQPGPRPSNPPGPASLTQANPGQPRQTQADPASQAQPSAARPVTQNRDHNQIILMVWPPRNVYKTFTKQLRTIGFINEK